MNILEWIRSQMATLSDTDAELARRLEEAETLLAQDDAEEAVRTLSVELPEDRHLLARALYVKIRASVRLRDLASLDGLALHAETLAEILPEQAKYLMLEAEAIGALGLAKALAEGISLAGVGAGEDILRIQQKKVSRIVSMGCLDIARTALGREYEDIRLIGWGQTSYVVSALPRGKQHRVAVKFLGPHSYRDEKGRARFEREAEVLRKLDHPGILKVYAFHPEEPPYMVTEFFPGADLRRLLEQGRAFFPGETARIGLQLCSAVAAAHEARVVHRNVQPANVLINYQNHVKLIDFGMARLSASSDISTTGVVLGEWLYMSPEQFAGCPDGATREMDIFGIGATLYHLVTRRPPFSRGRGLMRQPGPSIEELAPKLPRQLREVISRALKEDPMERWGSVADMIPLLQEVAS